MDNMHKYDKAILRISILKNMSKIQDLIAQLNADKYVRAEPLTKEQITHALESISMELLDIIAEQLNDAN